jgi:Domain of unknown function (DUF4279)
MKNMQGTGNEILKQDESEGLSVLYDVQKPEFYYSASLRISGESLDLDEITRRLGLDPTHQHRRGERQGSRSQYEADMWAYKAPIEETEHLAIHLKVLWEAIRPQKEYLKQLKERFWVDVFCGFRTNCQVTGIEVDHRCLEIFTELEIPFGLSIINIE